MKYYKLKAITFLRDLHIYSFERKILGIVLFNYALLGFISFIALFFIRVYLYSWPLWVLIIIISLLLMEATLRVKSIKKIQKLVLIISTFILAPLGLYFSGSITTPSSIYILVVLINICLLSEGIKRLFYFSSLGIITISFIIIESYFPALLIFPPPSTKDNLKLWKFIYIGLAYVIFMEVSSITNVIATQGKFYKRIMKHCIIKVF